MGIPPFRRFRITHLRTKGIPEDILRFWLGHADKSITDRYSQMKLRTTLRKKLVADAGLGFEIPAELEEKGGK